MNIIQNADFEGRNVLLRIDADVKFADGEIIDDGRLKASLPTIQYLLEKGAKVTIIGHLGRPKGKYVAELKIRPVEDKLIELLGTHTNWQILENLRFNPGEENNEAEFAKQLAAGQDLFVQDAFASCHRAHASTVGVAQILPSYAGLSVQKEVENLTKILETKDNFTIIIGGKKAEDKLPVIINLFDKADIFLLGGVVANTFLVAQGYNLGKSLVEKEVIEKSKMIMAKFKENPQKKILLPIDLVFSKSISEPQEVKICKVDELAEVEEFFAVDIGLETIRGYKEIITRAKTIFWNGNMGVSEIEEFSQGTKAITSVIAKNLSAQKYAGGGDTTAFIRESGMDGSFEYLSTGGGATLEFLGGKKLPGLEALGYNNERNEKRKNCHFRR